MIESPSSERKLSERGNSRNGKAGSVAPVIVLRDALYNDLRGGYRDTIAQPEGPLDETKAQEMRAQEYLNRLLFNRNSFVLCIPESVWGEKAIGDPRLKQAFEMSVCELGGTRFLNAGRKGEALRPEEVASDESLFKNGKSGFQNSSSLRLDDGQSKLVSSFTDGWPPYENEKKSRDLLARLAENYAESGVFNGDAVRDFLSNYASDRLEKFKNINPGKDGFRDTMLLFAKDENVLISLYSLDVWDNGEREGDERIAPAFELIERLARSFESAGEHKEDIEHFQISARRSLIRYLSYEGGRSSPTNGTFSIKDKFRSDIPEDDRYERLKIAWIYNIVIPAFYGPAEAVDNCFGDIASRKTMVANVRYSPQPVIPGGALSHGMGDAVIRRLCSDGSHRDVVHLDLDKIPEHGRELFRLFGRDYDRDEIDNVCKSLDTYDEHLRMARELVPGTPRGRFADLAQTDPSEVNADVRKLTVSRAHFAIFFADGEAILVDTKSRTGTKVMRADGTVFLVAPDPRAEPSEGVDKVVTGLTLRRSDRILLGAQDFLRLEVV